VAKGGQRLRGRADGRVDVVAHDELVDPDILVAGEAFGYDGHGSDEVGVLLLLGRSLGYQEHLAGEPPQLAGITVQGGAGLVEDLLLCRNSSGVVQACQESAKRAANWMERRSQLRRRATAAASAR
jgi:hypothetical protein